MSILEKTYQLIKNSPDAMLWEEYERSSVDSWTDLISGHHANNEQMIHEFLEKNPSFIPGAFSFPASGHDPIFCGVFSKPPLTGVGIRVPDFMWLATATDVIFPIFIEIETPAKLWFTKTGRPRAEFTQVRNQLVGWKQWLNNPSNRRVFLDRYRISERFRDFDIHPQFVLVYVRRSEFEESPQLRGIRAMQQGRMSTI